MMWDVVGVRASRPQRTVTGGRETFLYRLPIMLVSGRLARP
jgi:hypothetical protein